MAWWRGTCNAGFASVVCLASVVRSPTELRELRDSDEYRKTYEAVLQFAERIDPHNVAGFCERDAAVQH